MVVGLLLVGVRERIFGVVHKEGVLVLGKILAWRNDW